MNILQLCNKVPFPPKDGGCMAMNNLTQGLLQEGHKLKVVAINTKKHFTEIDTLPEYYRIATGIEAIFVDTDVKVSAAFLNLFSEKSYNISRFYSKAVEEKLIRILKSESFDIVQLESLYVSMYAHTIRKHSKAKIVLRAHNIEHQLWELAAQQAGNPIKKMYLKLLAKRLKHYELNSLTAFDAIVPITKSDELFFKNVGYTQPMQTIPFGIEIKTDVDNSIVEEEYPSVFHIGAMDWQPNIEGLNWFLNEVWDKVLVKQPDLKLYLAGRNMQTDYWTQLNKPNVTVVGEVENAQQFIQSKGIMIVPLLSGAGMRVKIIEGFSLGKTIITTKTGAEGIDVENNINCIIAANANEFADAISKCVTNKQFYSEIGQNARATALKQYNNSDICKRLTQFYEQLTSRN
jgi:glycosyltransferase involved in cell wall biosynthesis